LDVVTGPERHELAELSARLFGLDGSGEGGAFGILSHRITSIETQMDEWRGAIRLVKVMAGSGVARLLMTAPSGSRSWSASSP
jgi:hypothetical protein